MLYLDCAGHFTGIAPELFEAPCGAHTPKAAPLASLSLSRALERSRKNPVRCDSVCTTYQLLSATTSLHMYIVEHAGLVGVGSCCYILL